jgi:protease I
MAERRLDGKRVAILVTDNFEQVELTEPRQALEQAGAQVHIISDKAGQVQGFNHDEKGDRLPVDFTFDQARMEDYDALLLPGGALNADKLRMVPAAREWVQYFDNQSMPMAVICHAPWLLVSAGLVDGRQLTSYYTLQDDIRNAGGHWEDRPVVRDGNWVTSRNPGDIPEFNAAMLELFEQETVGREIPMTGEPPARPYEETVNFHPRSNMPNFDPDNPDDYSDPASFTGDPDDLTSGDADTLR